MKRVYFLMMTILSVIFMTACGGKTTTSSNEEKESDANAAISDGHTSQNSLDWNGTYEGLLPCANCEGIETSITLNSDGTYALRTKYTGKDDKVHEMSGTFEWNDKGNMITLKDVNPQEQPSQYLVGENKLIQLDLEGNKIEGELADKYVLTKTN